MADDGTHLEVSLRNHVGACDVVPRESWPSRTCASGGVAAQPNPQITEPVQGANKAVRAALRLMLHTTISYAYYSPEEKLLGDKPSSYRQCRSNLQAFLRWGYPRDAGGGLAPRVVLNVIGDTPVPDLGGRDHIVVRKRKLVPADLYVHALTALEVLQGPGANNNTDYFVFLNCGVRGPYIAPTSGFTARLGAAAWLLPFVNRLKSGAILSGPSISCELGPHLQSYFLVATTQAVSEFILPKWRLRDKSKEEIVLAGEVGVSKSILQAPMANAFPPLSPSLDCR